MKTRFVIVVLTLACSSAAMSVFAASMKDLLYQGTTANDMALFHGDKHLNRGIKCKDCHNKDIFPEKKFGAAKITMKTIAAGKHCGACHNGKQAFSVTGKCNVCHPNKSGDMIIYD